MPSQQEELLFILKMRDEATRVLNRHGQGLRQTGGQAQRAKRDLADFQQAAVAGAAALGAFYAQTKLLRGTLGVFGAYEQGMINVAKTTGLAGDEFDDFQDRFRELAADLTTPIAELQEIATVAGQVGVKGSDNLITFTRALAQLATASDVAGAQGAEAIARLLNVTETGVDQVGNVAASLVALGNDAAATESQILRASTVIGQSLAQFGVGADEVLGLATSVVEVGQAGELAGTTFFRTFQALKDGALEGSDGIRQLAEVTGRSMEEVRQTIIESPVAGFRLFLEALGEVQRETGSTTEFMKAFGLTGVEAARVLGPLVQRLQDLDGNLARASDEYVRGTAHTKEYAENAKGLFAQLSRLGNVASLVGTALGEDLAEPAKIAIDALIETTRGLIEVYEALPDSIQAVIAVSVTLAPTIFAAATAFKVLAPVLLPLAANLLRVATALRAVSLAMVATPWGAAIAAAAALAGGIAYLATRTSDAEERTAELQTTLEEITDLHAQVAEASGVAAEALTDQAEAKREAAVGATRHALALAGERQEELELEAARVRGGRRRQRVMQELRSVRAETEQLRRSLAELQKLELGAVFGPPEPPPAVRAPLVDDGAAQSGFLADAEARIRLLHEEAASIREGEDAYRRFKEAQRIEADVAGLRKEALEAGLASAAVDRLVAQYRTAAQAIHELRRASEARREAEERALRVAEEAAELRAEQVDFTADVEARVRELEREAAALDQGQEAYAAYQRARQIEGEVAGIRERAEALGLEEEEIRRLTEAVEANANARDAAAERLREVNERQAEAERLARSLAAEFTRSASSMVFDSDNAREAAANLTQALAELVLQASLLKPVEEGLTAAFSSQLGGGGGGFFCALSQGFSSALLFHGGGQVGETSGTTRRVPLAAFRGAPRYHDGLGGDEFAAVLQRGERVLTPEQDRRTIDVVDRLARKVERLERSSGGVTVVQNITTPNANSFRQSQGQIAAETAALMQRQARRNG